MAVTRRTTVFRGTVAGASAFVVGYAVAWIFAGTRASGLTVTGPFGGGGVPDWRALLWLFYDSHFVGTRTPELFGPGGDRLAGGELVDTVALLGVEFLYAVPVLVLLLAGVALAQWAGAAGPRVGALAGGAVAAGYLLAAVAGLFVATQGGVAPSPLRAVVVAGVVYPVAFGAAGGFAAGLLGERAEEERRESAAR